MGLALTKYELGTPVDLYSRGTFPGLLFVPESFEQELVPPAWIQHIVRFASKVGRTETSNQLAT
jgi:hypothetical protein